MNVIGLKTFVAREVQRAFRVYIQTILSPLINALLYILIFGVVVGSTIQSVGGFSYIDFVLPGILMLNLINSAFSQTSSSLYFQRFAKHIEEILVAPLSHMEMIAGYVIAGVARGLIVGLGVYVIALIFSAATIAHLGLFILYTIAVAVIFSLLGLLVALWAQNFEQELTNPGLTAMRIVRIDNVTEAVLIGISSDTQKDEINDNCFKWRCRFSGSFTSLKSTSKDPKFHFKSQSCASWPK